MRKAKLLTRAGKDNVLSRLPIIELVGQHRVLIENHHGILCYSLSEIHIKVSYGCISVNGSDLHLIQMSKEQLVISGKIDSVQLFGR